MFNAIATFTNNAGSGQVPAIEIIINPALQDQSVEAYRQAALCGNARIGITKAELMAACTNGEGVDLIERTITLAAYHAPVALPVGRSAELEKFIAGVAAQDAKASK